MSEEELINQLDNLRDKLKRLKEGRLAAIQRIHELKRSRSELVEALKARNEELRKLREEKARLVNERKRIVEERRKVIAELRSLRGELLKRREVLNALGSVDGIDAEMLRKRIDSLEWRIITESLSLAEENKLIKEIGRLERVLNRVLEARKLGNEVLELRAGLTSLSLRLKELNESIDRLSSSISQVSSAISRVIRDKLEVKKKLDDLRNEIQVALQELENINSKLEEARGEYNAVKSRLKEVRIAKAREVEERIINEKRRLINEKIQKGERLSIDDLRLLYGEYNE